MHCPACGSQNVTTTQEASILKVPYGPDAVFPEQVDSCASCGCVGDFTQANTHRARAAYLASVEVSVGCMLDHLSAKNISPSYIDRALRMPAGTTLSWREKISPEALALLRIIRYCPDILAVADNNFTRSEEAKDNG